MNIFLDLFLSFAKIGAFTFGGGYAMISLLEHECVNQKNWITSDELMDITVIAESTPGPIAINCATYTGYKQGGIGGAVIATLGIVLPSFFIILIISSFFEQILDYSAAANAFKGIRLAVSLLIIQAGMNMVKKLMKKTPAKSVNIAFVVGFFILVLLANLLNIHVSSIYLIIIAGLSGLCIYTLPGEDRGQQ